MDKLIDTHAHLYLTVFEKDLDEVLERSESAGVGRIYMPNIDHVTIEPMLELEERSSVCEAMIGLHPCSVDKKFERALYEVEAWLSKRKWCAIGEIGTDLYWDKTFRAEQQEAFNIQCQWAIDYNRPVVIHCRESIDETIGLVENFAEKGLRGVFHCFTGDKDQAKRITDLGFYLGIGGVATFKNSGLDHVLPHIALDKLVLETDSPYLSPVPHRGKRNEPARVRDIAQRIAEVKGEDYREVVSKTTENALRLYA